MTVDLPELLPSWLRSLRAERKSESTVRSYETGVRRYLDWAVEHGLDPALSRRQVASFTESLLAQGVAPATARSRQQSVRRFSAWLVAEEELDCDPLLGLKPPKVDAPIVEPLTDAQLKALLKTCASKSLRDLRDLAVLRVMIETGMRAGEVANLMLADIDLDAGTAVVRRGKGGRGRMVPFGPQAAAALDRYIRVRRMHRLARTSPRLWLGSNGQEFGYGALHLSLAKRAAAAGIEGFHPHLLRHTAAHRWLAAGGSEGGLMAVAGWSSREMLDRYSRHHASSRAAEEARALNLGDL